MFGSFTYKTRTLGKEITSPFALLAKATDDRISYIQFLEATFGTSVQPAHGISVVSQPAAMSVLDFYGTA